MSVVNWDDPCARALALTTSYYQLISGANRASVEYLANGATRKVSYSFADIKGLRLRMLEAQDACSLANGRPAHNRRFAITAGSQRFGNFSDPFSSNNT